MGILTNPIFQNLGAVLLLINKFLLWANKKQLNWNIRNQEIWAWGISLAGLVLLTPYTVKNKLWTTLVYNGCSAIVQVYAIYLKTSWSEKHNDGVLRNIKIGIILFSLAGCIYFGSKVGSPNFNGWQLVQSITGLIGTLLLAIDVPRTRLWGWVLYIPSHLCVIYITWTFAGEFIAVCQGVSIYFAYLGIKDEKGRIKWRKITGIGVRSAYR